MHHYQVLCVIDVSYASSLGPMHRLCVLCIVFVCYVLSWDPMCHHVLSLCPTYLHWILHVIVGPYVLLLDPMFCHWILHVVVGSYMLLSGPTHHCWGSQMSSSQGKHRQQALSSLYSTCCSWFWLAVVGFDSLLSSTRPHWAHPSHHTLSFSSSHPSVDCLLSVNTYHCGV